MRLLTPRGALVPWVVRALGPALAWSRGATYSGGMLFAFSIAPATTPHDDGSMADIVARAVDVIRKSGLPHETNSMFTIVEGDWDQVMPVIKAACEAVGEVSPRVSLVLKADLRPGHTGEMTGKVERLDEQIAKLEA